MPLINPMTGSGTLAIEAAMMARNLAPGLDREILVLCTYNPTRRSCG